MIKRIHVSQPAIRSRESHPIRVKTYKSNTPARSVTILSPDGTPIAKVRYEPEHPLSCGARVWVETEAELEIET